LLDLQVCITECALVILSIFLTVDMISLQMKPGIMKVIDYDFDKLQLHLVLLEEWLDVQEAVNTSEV
jgi:hypothetical protein